MDEDIIAVEFEGDICVPDDVYVFDAENSWSESGLESSDSDD